MTRSNLRARRFLSAMLAATACFVMAMFSACESTGANGGGGSRVGRNQPAPTGQETVAALDRDYVIGPTAAGQMNYRIAWQFKSRSDNPVKIITLHEDSAYLLDERNFLTRVNLADGRQRWHTQAAEAVLDVQGVNVADEKVYLTAGSEMLVFDAINGTQTGKWRLEKVAGTAPVNAGEFLIYGSRGGDVVWLSRQIGYMWRAYHIAQSMRVPPVLRGNVIAAVGNNGEVLALNAGNATQYWSKKLLDAVTCKPVLGEEAMYVAGRDQYLWAFDLSSGRTLWKVLQEAPLVSSPTLIEDRVYQQIPGRGIACYNALPVDAPGGESIWRSEKARGDVILARPGEIFAWDGAAHKLTILEANRGLIKTTIDLPQVVLLTTGGENGREIFAAGKDGRMVRLVPRT